ncbi:BRO family protein [Sporolactobacillus shoreicorticis]|uniref:Bro-N domain-containing protein n=1 Tax=Sporolactobacillus shoreicorticis TaxID=1923877 RepID=A0ABW5SAU6_9BACL|nr:BRO family protein [Sporolactobacillus shoreicorticis]MCO7128242.1 BRO family protein [Sporolactobacillus shoreicorticis]
MSEIKIFENPEFGELPTVMVNGEPEFGGKEAALMLGYANPLKAIRDHCISKGVNEIDTPSNGGIQKKKFITKGNVIRLVTHSHLPGADKFESWIFDKVIPQVLETGSYSMNQDDELKRKRLEIMERNAEARDRKARNESAKLLMQIRAGAKSETYKQVLESKATEIVTGQQLLPLPEAKQISYPAEAVGKKIGCSGNMVGRIAKKLDIKTEKYGRWIHDKSRYANREVMNFEYYDNAIPLIKAEYRKRESGTVVDIK